VSGRSNLATGCGREHALSACTAQCVD